MRKKLSICLTLFFLILNVQINFSLDQNIYLRFKKGTKKSEIWNIIKSEGFKTFNQLLPEEASFTVKLQKGAKILGVDNKKLEKILLAEEPLLRTYELSIETGLSIEKFCSYLLKKYPQIEIAEPIYFNEILEIPNDPLAPSQTMLSTIKAFQTWDSIKGDTNVVIGIVDIGVLQEHEDLSASIAINWLEIPDNGIDDDGNGFVDDYRGCNLAYAFEGNGGNTFHPSEHGTAVAGIAGATTNNSKGIAGVGYKCRIFPIKASKVTNLSTIDYGYKGILYAGIRGFDVVNCSWGKSNKPPSPIEQSIIDYAISRGVVVVAAAGNERNASTMLYPAGYFGVLSVGEVNQVDYVTTNTSINESVRIMAPGEGNYITLNTPNGYEASTRGGTSFAAPVVSGAVAIVRSQYPELDPLQTIEYVRQLTDDISDKNQPFQYLIPGRINLSKLLEIQPFSIPGIKPLKISFSRTDGTSEDRFFLGDTVIVNVDAYNYLGSAKNLRFVLSTADIFDNSLQVLDAEQELEFLPQDTKLAIGPFSFKIVDKNDNPTFLRVDILGENSYKDFFLIRFVPTSYITTFENDSIKFSISDKGTLGFYRNTSNQFGFGVGSKKFGNQIYKAGLMVSEDSSKIVTALYGLAPDGSDFRVLKPFAGKEKNVSIIDDSLAQQIDRIGVQIQQFVYVPPDGENYFKIYFTVRNTSGKVLKNLSIGYFQDWDVGTSAKENFSYLEPDAIPRSILPISAAVQFIQSSDSSVFVGVGVISDNSTYIPQSAVLSSDFTSAFSRDKQILSLNSGTKIQFKGVDDISIVSGMKFPGEIYPGETRSFTMMISITDSRENLKQIFLRHLLENPTNYSESFDNKIHLYPNPASEFVFVQPINSNIYSSKFQIFDYLGNLIDEGLLNANFIDVSRLPTGVYYLKIYSKQKVFIQRFVLIR